MRFYSRLPEDERDQIGVLRAAGRSTGLGFIKRRSGDGDFGLMKPREVRSGRTPSDRRVRPMRPMRQKAVRG